MKHLICNLKSNQLLPEIGGYIEEIKKIETNDIELVICPSFPYLPFFTKEKITSGAQDISEYDEGAYTGEINGKQLASLNVKYVIVGHSERRKYYKESDEVLVNKIKQALENKLKIIYCVGETKEEYLRKKTYVIIEKQIGRVLNEFNTTELKNIIVAYEPVWSIGTGNIPEKSEIEDVTLFIKKLMDQYYHIKTPVLYGGSVNEKNIDELKSIESLDGLLIGGASLDPKKLNSIIQSVK